MEEEKKTVDISPISKGKRLLAFLADFFLVFIITFVVFNALVMPVGNAITKFNDRQTRNNDAAIAQFSILYNQKVMFHENDADIYAYNQNVEYTMNCFLSYYAFNDGEVVGNHPQYGHFKDNEVVRHFYCDIRDDKKAYFKLFNDFNNEYPYFLINEEIITLKDDIKSNVKLSFVNPDDMSSDGKTALGNLQNFFMNAYAAIFKDIEQNDLVDQGSSYLANKAIVNEMEEFLKWQLCLSSIISYLVAIIVYFILLPVCNKDGRTLAMMMMRLSRIGTNNLYLLNKGESVINAIYMLPFNLLTVFFMPMTYVTFTYLFNIHILPAFGLIGLLLMIASLVVILVSSFNRSISDYLSRSVLIKNEDLDEIYRSKGYDI